MRRRFTEQDTADPFANQCEVYEVLGAADASVAWCAKIGSNSGYYSALLEEDAARALFL
jgi:indole-3-acetate monooxygenase